MRSALETARTIPETAATLTAQHQFDRALAKLVAKIPIPRETEQWFVNGALIKGAKRNWKKTARHPAIVATALAVLVMMGLGAYLFVEQLHDFPGAAIAKKLLVVANNTSRSQFDRLNTDAINLGDYFFMKFQLEHFDVPMQFADFRATGARVFEDEEGHRIAQVGLAESGVQFFLYSAEQNESQRRATPGFSGWRYVEAEGWAGAVEERGGVYFMIARHGDRKELEPYLSDRRK